MPIVSGSTCVKKPHVDPLISVEKRHKAPKDSIRRTTGSFTSVNDVVLSPRRYFPFGIVFLVAGKILDMHDPAHLGEKLGMYFITVLSGLFVHGLILLPLFFYFFTRKNPFPYIRGLLQALVIALATSSR